MIAYKLILVFLILGESYGVFTHSNENTGCGIEYWLIMQELSHSSATKSCTQLGYDGLAIILNDQQRLLVGSILENATSTVTVEAWVSLEYYGPQEHDWKWRRNGQWLNISATYAKDYLWRPGEPDNAQNEACARLLMNENLPVFRSTTCSSLKFPLCQRNNSVSDASSRSTELKSYLKNKEKPDISMAGSSRIIPAKSLIHCSLLCLQDCQCRFIYYHSYNCYIITRSDVINTIGAGSGNYYRKFL